MEEVRKANKAVNELVVLKNNDIFTDSLVIAEGTDNKHKNVKEMIVKYENDLKDFGTLSVLNVESTGGRPEQYYMLNEQQATFLMTLLRNSKTVVVFKKELVKQFYQMRQLLLEKQTQLWQNTREESKVNRLMETDEIKQLVEYAKSQGSKNADKYYITFSKLANKAVGLDSGQRDNATAKQLNNLTLIENIINNVIKDGIDKEIYYKEIYQKCKNRISSFLSTAYLEAV